MGVKELWSVLTPFAERKPLSELRGKTVAIDLAGWVCESLNVVDYFVHPRQHLKNLFFRTCYLIWEEVTPIFVLEGAAPSLKSKVMSQRNELQFRGVKTKEPPATIANTQEKAAVVKVKDNSNVEAKKRTRFNHVLKQCENLLKAMGIECVQATGEAEAYCAFLNRRNLVDGVISQDSDCFAYGAVRVYRNFSVSMQGAQASQGGAVDIYDMTKISQVMDFGQDKIIAMALFCGCDYCPEGIGGVGRDSVLKLFAKYKETEILKRLMAWRAEDAKYTSLEMRVNDKNICSNCGHMGRTQAHTKSGCGVCRTPSGCDDTLWKEQRLSIKAELALRKKALMQENFPCQEIIEEFKTEPANLPKLNLKWAQPNMVRFIKQLGHLLQWTEIYCFAKFLPILTRWQVRNAKSAVGMKNGNAYVKLKEIVKKRIVKGVPSFEIVWHDEAGFFTGLIPDEQLETYEGDLQKLWSTLEPMSLVEAAYPDLVEEFHKKHEKPQRKKKTTSRKQKENKTPTESDAMNMKDLALVTNEIAENVKPTKAKVRHKKRSPLRGIQKLDKFFKSQQAAAKSTQPTAFCSTPQTKFAPSDLDSSAADEALNLSAVIDGMIRGSVNQHKIVTYSGRRLQYETLNLSRPQAECALKTKDDIDVNILQPSQKRERSILSIASLDDSFDVLVKAGERRLFGTAADSPALQTHVKRFKQQHGLNSTSISKLSDSLVEDNMHMDHSDAENVANASYFFGGQRSSQNVEEMEDEFERIMQASFMN